MGVLKLEKRRLLTVEEPSNVTTDQLSQEEQENESTENP